MLYDWMIYSARRRRIIFRELIYRTSITSAFVDLFSSHIYSTVGADT